MISQLSQLSQITHPSHPSRLAHQEQLELLDYLELPTANRLKKNKVCRPSGGSTLDAMKSALLLLVDESCLDGIEFGANLLLVSGNLCLELVELVADALHNLAV